MGKRNEYPTVPDTSPFHAALKSSGLTIAQLIKKSGLAGSTIYKILRGEENVLLRHVRHLCEILHLGMELRIGKVMKKAPPPEGPNYTPS